ncbi:GPI-anchored small secreted protein [Laccaria bicolor S238N-H82]|uniref:GPI-anchored small secreted protein n=1 Tax=Laccaria bicolor (strain S238N-H82 / ATCC MYA-4686) TaxID=486041 RepID=B0DID5_LACBS|nr:GPI-anchored small secreted protein [Laccaria bicolor S238N-H82]EDR05547.1 GPI-anchored small secreted protein [Laccaria bicolor S238N-H82]|eukprot:XP_001883651.1 GPI-anchored small secreted protein [Laccaria bicolor S238N-H82]
MDNCPMGHRATQMGPMLWMSLWGHVLRIVVGPNIKNPNGYMLGPMRVRIGYGPNVGANSISVTNGYMLGPMVKALYDGPKGLGMPMILPGIFHQEFGVFQVGIVGFGGTFGGVGTCGV